MLRLPVTPSPRLRTALAALPLALYTVLHLAEQWAVFDGRSAWVARMHRTSRGPVALAVELVVILAPLALTAVWTVRDLLARRPLPGAARPDDTGVVRVLGRLAPFGTVLALVFLAVHVGTLWGPKVFASATELQTWRTLQVGLASPAMLVFHAVGLTAVAVHLAASLPAAFVALGWVRSDEGRRSAWLVASVFALCVWVLAAQLVGWIGTGTGTFWPITVTER